MHQKIKEMLNKDFEILDNLSRDNLLIVLQALADGMNGTSPYRTPIKKMYYTNPSLDTDNIRDAVGDIILSVARKHYILRECYESNGNVDFLSISEEIKNHFLDHYHDFLCVDNHYDIRIKTEICDVVKSVGNISLTEDYES